VLLATKLHVPGPRPGFVARPRLARALGEGAGPEGWSWYAPPARVRQDGRYLADWGPGPAIIGWRGLSLDAADNDPVRFFGVM